MNKAVHVDQEDLLILNALQNDIPLVHNPWDEIGRVIGLSGEEVLRRVQNMRNVGVIRSISPTLESAKRKSGVSTLIALQVPDDRIKDVAAIVNGYSEVSHNFRREGHFNLWFTLAGDSEEGIGVLIKEILNKTGITPDKLLDLRTVRAYKADVKFPILLNEGEDQ
jgi:siroheme decarboxylase